MTGAIIGPFWGGRDLGVSKMGSRVLYPAKWLVSPQKKSIPTSNNKKWMMNSQKKNRNIPEFWDTSFLYGEQRCVGLSPSLPLVFLEKSLEVDEVLETLRAQQAAQQKHPTGVGVLGSWVSSILCFAGILCVMSDEINEQWLTIFPTKWPANEQSVGGGSHQPVYFLCGLSDCSFCRPAVNCDSFVSEVLFSKAGCAFVSPWWVHRSNCSAQDSSFEKKYSRTSVHEGGFDTCLHVKSLTTTLVLLGNLKIAGKSNQFRLLFR